MNMVIMWLLLPVWLTTAVGAMLYVNKKTKDCFYSIFAFLVVTAIYTGIFMACITYNGHKLTQYYHERAEAARHKCTHCGGER